MNDQSEAPKLWATAGESITCIKGHAICDIAHNIYVGDPRCAQDFTNWRQPEPDKAQGIGALRCVECRGAWVRGNPREGFQFHFGADLKDGWR